MKNSNTTITRRTFSKQTLLLLSSLMLPQIGHTTTDKKKYKMGLQAFTIRDALKDDLIGSLKIVKSLGYEDLELYGFEADKDSYYGHKSTDFKRILDDVGLTSSSCHYGFSDYLEKTDNDLMRFVDACIKGAKALDHSYITWPWMHPKYRNTEIFTRLPEILNKIGEQVTQAGLGFAYHNHDFEFHTYGTKTGYEIILEQTDPKLVKLQLDLYWAVHSSSLSPEKLIAIAPERFVMWHIKDMDKFTRDYSELGNGSIDYESMLPLLDKTGLEFYYIEQGGNFAKNDIQSITDSANYFKNYLQQHL